jgi:hypothetical protein
MFGFAEKAGNLSDVEVVIKDATDRKSLTAVFPPKRS